MKIGMRAAERRGEGRGWDPRSHPHPFPSPMRSRGSSNSGLRNPEGGRNSYVATQRGVFAEFPSVNCRSPKMNERESQIKPGERVVLLNKMEAQRRERRRQLQ